jgi:hypothetical protein
LYVFDEAGACFPVSIVQVQVNVHRANESVKPKPAKKPQRKKAAVRAMGAGELAVRRSRKLS